MSITSSPWQSEFNERISHFSRTIGVDLDKVKEVLAGLGIDGSSEQSLQILESEEFLPLSDLFKSFVDSGLAPIAKVRLGNRDLRGNSGSKESAKASEFSEISASIESLAKASRPKSAWSDEELLDAYDQNDTETLEILRKRAHGRHCIVYLSDGSVNKSVSLSILKLAKRQVTNNRHMINGMLVKVYRPGEFPASMIEESPLRRGSPLVAGVCGETGTDWNGIPHEVRVMARIHVYSIETVKLGVTALRQICEDAKAGETSFRQKYQEASLMYDDLSRKGQLPTLKLDSCKDAEASRSDTGF